MLFLTYFLDSGSYVTVVFSNQLLYELSGPSNVYTYMCALHLLSCLFRVRVFIKCLKLYAFSIILTTFFLNFT